ncbi:MAG: hypothetical protein ACREX9_08555 [Gammaproteobacteria bacterium]
MHSSDKHRTPNPALEKDAVKSAAPPQLLLAVRHWRNVSAVFTFIESSAFERVRPAYLDDDEYAELQQSMMLNPEAGQVVRGSGGVRKLRWSRPGMGKRGGLRVIYFVRYEPNEFWMLTMYAKAKYDNVPAQILKQLVEAFQNG